MKNRIIAEGGSIQNIGVIPDSLKLIYKTVWEISQRALIDMAADRGAYIGLYSSNKDQSQSLNIHMKEATHGNMTSMHFYGWKRGLKTGMYYLRTRPAADAIKFTVDRGMLSSNKENVVVKPVDPIKGLVEKVVGMSVEDQVLACSLENKEACEMCSG